MRPNRTYPSPLWRYDTIQTIEKIGKIPIPIISLKDLDQTVDAICEHYGPKPGSENIKEQSDALLSLCPYFGIIWPAARGLAGFIESHKAQFHKRLGIEVGAGLALPSIVAQIAGARMVVTDFHLDVRAFVEKNYEMNYLPLHFESWDWTASNIESKTHLGAYDFVLASDVLYEQQHPHELVTSLARLVRPDGKIYLADPGRVYLETALEEFKKFGFESYEAEIEVEESTTRPAERAEVRLGKKRAIRVFEFFRS